MWKPDSTTAPPPEPMAASAPGLRAAAGPTLLHLHRPDPAALYFVQLSLFHQDMHNEAFAYTWQTAGWPWPGEVAPYTNAAAGAPVPWPLAAADIDAGARLDEGFVFDNEKWAHEVRVQPFRIARFCPESARMHPKAIAQQWPLAFPYLCG